MSNLLSNLEIIEDLRTIWKNEAKDFSKWLAKEENLEILGNQLGIEIIEPELEKNVGSFSVDISATNSDGKTIIIENQLEKTDHKHLGQIITYASGLEAEYIIWIVKTAGEEHRKAIDWLNENTGEGLNFFLIEIKLYKIGDSLPAPKFEIIAKPNDWSKQVKINKNDDLSDYELLRIKFWQQFIDYSDKFTHRTASKGHWFGTAIGSSEYHVNFGTSKQNEPGAYVEFITSSDKYYDIIFKQIEYISNEIGMELKTVKRSKGGIFYIQYKYAFADNTKWNEIFDFYLKYYEVFKEVFPKIIKEYVD